MDDVGIMRTLGGIELFAYVIGFEALDNPILLWSIRWIYQDS